MADMERLLIVLIENPQVACVSPRVRMTLGRNKSWLPS